MKQNKRPSFEQLYLSIASLLSQRSHHSYKVGCIITTHDNLEILASGVNGIEAGGKNKPDSELPGQSGTIHSEVNAAALCKAPRNLKKIVYVTTSPCLICARVLINLGGIKRVVYLKEYRNTKGIDLLRRRGIIVHKYRGDLCKSPLFGNQSKSFLENMKCLIWALLEMLKPKKY